MREGGGSWWEWVERAGAAEADGEVNSRAGGGGWACAGAMRWASSRGAPGRTGRGLLMGAGMVPPQSANRSPRPAQHSPRLSRWLALEADAEALRTGFALPAAALAALLSTPWRGPPPPPCGPALPSLPLCRRQVPPSKSQPGPRRSGADCRHTGVASQSLAFGAALSYLLRPYQMPWSIVFSIFGYCFKIVEIFSP
jgi:hypothetical protein